MPLLSRFMPQTWRDHVLPLVAAHFADASPQHPARQWEYSMALLAVQEWRETLTRVTPKGAIDVGGAGSPLAGMLRASEWEVEVVDPAAGTGSIEEFIGEPAAAVFAISVIEHVEDPLTFVEACLRTLRPGGLFFLTTDAQEHEGEDRAHYHWLRKRIYSPTLMRVMVTELVARGCMPLGEVDYRWTYPIDGNLGYTFASLAVVKNG